MARRSATELEYIARINRVIDHVHGHLADAPRLKALARVACLSPFHFHRVFRAITGETVRAFVARARVERVALLLGRAGSQRRLTDLAPECGFSSPAELSRAFRARFGVTPSAYRRAAQKRKNPQAAPPAALYLAARGQPSSRARLSPRIVTAPERHLAYVRVIDAFAPGRLAAAHATLVAWARARACATPVLLGLSHDDPEITAPEQCRYDLGGLVPAGTRGGDGVSVRRLPGGTYVEVEARGDLGDVARVWDRLFTEWLPRSGFEPADGPGIERYLAPPDFETWRHLEVVLALPIARLGR